jgi:hypothetical protein
MKHLLCKAAIQFNNCRLDQQSAQTRESRPRHSQPDMPRRFLTRLWADTATIRTRVSSAAGLTSSQTTCSVNRDITQCSDLTHSSHRPFTDYALPFTPFRSASTG